MLYNKKNLALMGETLEKINIFLWPVTLSPKSMYDCPLGDGVILDLSLW